jgi:citrate lyase subunit beta/citryl-CoA lyase
LSVSLVYLFAPGDSERKLEKALQSAAAVVIIDLEDGVAESAKAAARETVAQTLSSSRTAASPLRPIVLRINSVDSPHFAADLELSAAVGVDGVMLPKCEGTEGIRMVSEAMPGVEILPLLETVAGIHNLPQIIEGSNGTVRRVAFGAVDYALDLGVEWSAEGEERRYAMGHIVFLSRALQLAAPIDAVFPVLNDDAGFLRDAQLGKQMGFGGKMIIHPRHIEAVRQVYRPSQDKLDWCETAVRLYEESNGTGALKLDGQLIDLPVYKEAKRLLALNNTSGV